MWKFRDDCLKLTSPLQPMGGCNLVKEEVQKGIRYAGKKISDPSAKVLGSFNVNEGKIIYSPIFPHFYDERDNIKFANAMHILQTQYIIKTDGDSEENQYWLNEGIIGYSFGEEKTLKKAINL